jgi:hypothetical protein
MGPGRRRTGAAARRSRYHGGVRALPYVLALALAGPAGGATAPAADAPAPAPFAARYEGHRFPLGARATLALARHGEYYKYSLRGAVYLGFFKGGEIYDCSVMRLERGVLRPLEYVHRDSRRPGRNLHTRFHWDEGVARTETGAGEVREVALAPPVWDVMSVQVRLRRDVATAAPGASFEYPVVYRGELRRQRARVEGRETLETEAGRIAATRVRSEDPKRTNFFWFAGDYAWLPVRLTVSGVTLELVSPPGEAARAASEGESDAGTAPPSC